MSKVNLQIYDITTWETNNCNAHLAQYLTMKFRQLIEYNVRNVLLEKSYTKCDQETIPRPFSKKSKLSISLDQ